MKVDYVVGDKITNITWYHKFHYLRDGWFVFKLRVDKGWRMQVLLFDEDGVKGSSTCSEGEIIDYIVVRGIYKNTVGLLWGSWDKTVTETTLLELSELGWMLSLSYSRPFLVLLSTRLLKHCIFSLDICNALFSTFSCVPGELMIFFLNNLQPTWRRLLHSSGLNRWRNI